MQHPPSLQGSPQLYRQCCRLCPIRHHPRKRRSMACCHRLHQHRQHSRLWPCLYKRRPCHQLPLLSMAGPAVCRARLLVFSPFLLRLLSALLSFSRSLLLSLSLPFFLTFIFFHFLVSSPLIHIFIFKLHLVHAVFRGVSVDYRLSSFVQISLLHLGQCISSAKCHAVAGIASVVFDVYFHNQLSTDLYCNHVPPRFRGLPNHRLASH